MKCLISFLIMTLLTHCELYSMNVQTAATAVSTSSDTAMSARAAASTVATADTSLNAAMNAQPATSVATDGHTALATAMSTPTTSIASETNPSLDGAIIAAASPNVADTSVREEALALAASEDKMFLSQPLMEWPRELYDNAWEGACYLSLSRSESNFQDALKQAASATQEQAASESWSAEQKIIGDWVYALQETEKHFLQKPFETWTMADIKQIAGYLTRLTVEHPGEFRAPKPRDDDKLNIPSVLLKELDESENQRFKSIVEKSHPTPEDLAFFCSIAHVFPQPDKIETELQEAFEKVKRLFKAAQEQTDRDIKLVAVIEIVAQFHYDVVRVRPFDDGSKRLARLLLHILFAQALLHPIVIQNAEAYREALRASLQAKSSIPLSKHLKEVFNHHERYWKKMTLLIYHAHSIDDIMQFITKELEPQGKASQELEAQVIQFVGSSLTNKSTKKGIPTTKLSCSQCNKVQEQGAPFYQCAGCPAGNKALYCSKGCQKAAWPQHKASCTYQSKKK